MTEKQILKRISNMKVHVKKITDGKQTGNRKIIMCPWEQQLYDILQGDANPTITKMACSLSAGFQSYQSGSSSLDVSSCSTYRHCSDPNEPGGSTSEMTPPPSRSSTPIPAQHPKRKRLSAETVETEKLSTLELQRLVLLEQLKYTRAKMARFEQQIQPKTGTVEPLANTTLTNMDNWQHSAAWR